MKCKNCGFENRSSVKFCEECGHAISKPASVEPVIKPASTVCPACGKTNRPGVKFCEECGHAIGSIGKPASLEPAIKPANTVCPACGKANRPGVKFCEECGHTFGKPVSVGKTGKRTEGLAITTCRACGHTNRRGVQFCEECGAALQRSEARGRVGMIGQFRSKWNTKKVAMAGLAFVVLAALMFASIDRLRYPVTKGEARDKADTIIDTYYPELADVAPQVAEYKGKNGETLQSYSYTRIISAQLDGGNAMQFSVGAVIVVDRKTGEVEVITIR